MMAQSRGCYKLAGGLRCTAMLVLAFVLARVGLVEAGPHFGGGQSVASLELRMRGNQFVRGVPCEAACEHCGCEGSYLGEKCICFCEAEDKESTNCLSAIRKDELRAGIDNDILILTSTGARFARDIRQTASLRARMGRGASVSWRTNSKVMQGKTAKKQAINLQQQ